MGGVDDFEVSIKLEGRELELANDGNVFWDWDDDDEEQIRIQFWVTRASFEGK